MRDRSKSVAFYAKLGFVETAWHEEPRVAILSGPGELEINLIVNAQAASAEDGGNVLMDVPEKHPGYTHLALRVASIARTVDALAEAGIAITEGPVALGDGYVALFVRDPDLNVVELGERLVVPA